ncbi:MAG: iron-containing alcohol dehydrogenase [Planctomycetota bacterium]|nr:MAG: iron-containing alcohol dehydrogenase [Planctomycetota bacterium]
MLLLDRKLGLARTFSDMSVQFRKFISPELIHGPGSRRWLDRVAVNMGLKRVCLITDKGVRQAGWVDQAVAQLIAAEIACVIFDGIQPNPRPQQVRDGVATYLSGDCDGIIAIGGGSVIDVAKGVAIMVSSGGDIMDFIGVDTVRMPCPPLICCPTTAGSSADVSPFAVINDEENGLKQIIFSKAIIPDVSLVDPETTNTLSQELIAETAMDALSHAMEALVSTAGSDLTRVHALRAIDLLTTFLPLRLRDRTNAEACQAVMEASLHAGLAFSNAGLGLVHAIAHTLGGMLDLPHGQCNAVILPEVVDFNYATCPELYQLAAKVMGCEPSQQALVDHLRGMQSQAMPGIQGLMADEYLQHLPRMIDNALSDLCLVTNPRQPAREDMEVLYRRLIRV